MPPRALGDAVITFVAAMPYALASGERDLYRSTASDFRIKMDQAMRDYEYAGFLTGEAGKALETCLMAALKVGDFLVAHGPGQRQDHPRQGHAERRDTAGRILLALEDRGRAAA